MLKCTVQIDSDRRLMIIVNRSISHPHVPATKQCVRVETYSSEMVIRPHSSFDEVFCLLSIVVKISDFSAQVLDL